jgi:hypothetical protein
MIARDGKIEDEAWLRFEVRLDASVDPHLTHPRRVEGPKPDVVTAAAHFKFVPGYGFNLLS